MIFPNMVKAFGSQSVEFQFYFSSTVKLKIAKTMMKALDQPSQPCSNHIISPSTSECIANFIEDQIGCRIKLHGNNNGINKKKTCNSGFQLQYLAKILSELKHADEKTIYELTGCLASCERHEYQGFEYQRTDVTWKMCGVEDDSCILTLWPEINDRSYDEKKQYVVYDFNSFIADVGGFMGLLLGFSILSIYDELTNILRRWKFGYVA